MARSGTSMPGGGGGGISDWAQTGDTDSTAEAAITIRRIKSSLFCTNLLSDRKFKCSFKLCGTSKFNHCAYGLALMHQVESLVDAMQWQGMGDQWIDRDLALHVPIHDLGYLGPATHSAKGGALPDPAGNELEGPGLYFLSCPRNSDDDAL